MKKLVLLGGGYGNMRILNHVTSSGWPEDVEIVLIDQEPYHCMKTEYYALAAGTISDVEVRVPFPEHPRLKIIDARIKSIDVENKRIELDGADSISYDQVVIGLGCEDKYHNIPGADTHTLSIQSIENVRETANTLSKICKGSHVAIVGGGLSGIEVASELRESRSGLKITLFDRGETILSTFPEKLGLYVQDWFRDHEVNVINRANITKVEPGVLYNKDEPVDVDVVVWTAGIQPNKLVRELPVEKDRSGRVIVTPHHFIEQYPDVFVVGDCASADHAPSAQLAEEQGDQIHEVLKSLWSGGVLPDLPEIKMRGVLGSLGKKKGFALVMGKTPITGRVARLLKSGVLWLYRYHNG